MPAVVYMLAYMALLGIMAWFMSPRKPPNKPSTSTRLRVEQLEPR